MEAQIQFLTAQVQALIQAQKDQQGQQDQLREASRSTTVILEQRLAAAEAALGGARGQDAAAGDRLRPFVDFNTMVPDKFDGGTPEQFQAWARKVKKYLNAKMRGMKVIFEKVETEEDELMPESTCTGSSS